LYLFLTQILRPRIPVSLPVSSSGSDDCVEIYADPAVNTKFQLFLYLTGASQEKDKIGRPPSSLPEPFALLGSINRLVDLPGTIVYGARPSFQQLFRGFVADHPGESTSEDVID
jgi:hypothetical protein